MPNYGWIYICKIILQLKKKEEVIKSGRCWPKFPWYLESKSRCLVRQALCLNDPHVCVYKQIKQKKKKSKMVVHSVHCPVSSKRVGGQNRGLDPSASLFLNGLPFFSL